MFCSGCGQELPDNAKFCRNCGTAVEGAAPSNGSRTNAAVEKSDTDTKKPVLFVLFFANVFLALMPFLPTMVFNSYFSKRDIIKAGFSLDGVSLSKMSSFMIDMSNTIISVGGVSISFFPNIILYGLLGIQIVFLYQAVRRYYMGINNGFSRIFILKRLRKSSVMAMIVCVLHFGFYVLFLLLPGRGSSPVDFTVLFWACLIGTIACIVITTNIIKQEKQADNAYKQNDEITADFTD